MGAADGLTATSSTGIHVSAIQHAEQAFRFSHAARLQDARERLPGFARNVLDALPLLLHANHPALPGFAGFDSPAGIRLYRPSRTTLNAVRRFSTSFRYLPADTRTPRILALFLMGSAGSVAHTRESDLDIWVCVAPADVAAVQSRLELLNAWAARLGVDLQCFAVTPGQFSGGPQAARSPLLLDEFYRTACHIAGQIPKWWVVPAQEPAAYERTAAHLTAQRYIHPRRFLDFGPVQNFDALELLAAGIRELQRSLATPHKSLLKLGLLESYANGARPLSTRYRTAIVASDKADTVDGYLMLAEHLDEYFARASQDATRRTFMRRAWLTKTSRGNVHLTRNADWWRLAQRWGYKRQDIDALRWPERWSLTNIVAEQERVMAEYAHALNFLDQLAEQCPDGTATRQYRDALSRLRVQLSAETRHSERLLPALVPKSQQGSAEIEMRDDQWCLLEESRVFIRRKRLTQIFQWLKRQGLSLNALAPRLRTNARYRQIFAALSVEPYVLLLNAEQATATPDEPHNATLVPHEDDPLTYGAERACLVQQLDLLRTKGSGAAEAYAWKNLADALPHLLALPHAPVVCVGDVRRGRIAQRVNLLLNEARDRLRDGSGNYFFSLERHLCCLHRDTDGVYHLHLYANAHAAFLSCPPAASSSFSRYGSGEHRGWLARLGALMAPTLIINLHNGDLYLDYRDERGTQRLLPPPRRPEEFMQNLSLYCAMLRQHGIRVPRLLVRRSEDTVEQLPQHGIAAHLRYRLEFTQALQGWQVRCGSEVWSAGRIDRQLLTQVRRQVLSQREADADYPIYLTAMTLQTNDFITHLKAKFALERILSSDAAQHEDQQLHSFRSLL